MEFFFTLFRYLDYIRLICFSISLYFFSVLLKIYMHVKCVLIKCRVSSTSSHVSTKVAERQESLPVIFFLAFTLVMYCA